MQARQVARDGSAGKASRLPGLSPRGHAVLASLEHARLWPGAAGQALRYWRAYQRDPYARRWDRPDSCGDWHCCPEIDEVRAILRTVLHNLPPRDARRFRSVLPAAEDLGERLQVDAIAGLPIGRPRVLGERELAVVDQGEGDLDGATCLWRPARGQEAGGQLAGGGLVEGGVTD
jgi:hypothetical protein